jgi:hypothetical protein
MKDLLYGLLGGGAGISVCFLVGFLIVRFVGIPKDAYFGVGLEPWNLPGTILGAATWGAIIWYTIRRR